MTEEEIRDKYEKMRAELSLGLRIPKQWYGDSPFMLCFDWFVCDTCGAKKVVLFGDFGATPYSLPCDCGERLYHDGSTWQYNDDKFYKYDVWVRPDIETLLKLSNECIDWVLSGGLILKSDLINIKSGRL